MKNYAFDSKIKPDQELSEAYGAGIQTLNEAFNKESPDKEATLATALEQISRYTPAGCAERFEMGSGYSLAKEFYCDVLAANAGAAVRILSARGDTDAARDLMLDIYRDCAANGFDRRTEFLCNRIDSRTFMPMRRDIDAAYLEAVGFDAPQRSMMCVGDCQTIALAENLRSSLSLDGMNFLAYQHDLGSLLESPLGNHFKPDAYFHFCCTAANYALFGTWPGKREAILDETRTLTDWLKQESPRLCVFVTHVFFGIDAAIAGANTPEDAAIDSATEFSDEVAEILSDAPNARLINFQDICPFTRDNSPFRDDEDLGVQLHFRFDLMDEVHKRVVAEFQSAGLP